jgi:hypothetical protein
MDETCPIKNMEKKNLIFSQIRQCVGDLFKCFENELTVFQPLSNAFELYGLDFLVDDSLGYAQFFKVLRENIVRLKRCLLFKS